MTLNYLTPFIALILASIMILSITKNLFKSRKRSSESIYKLINDLEKKYIS